VAQVEQFVHDVGSRQPSRVEDDGLAPLMVGADPDQAVSDSAELVADREHGDALVPDPVILQIEPQLPPADQSALPRVDNDSHYIMSPGSGTSPE
jgi:hypothetical protein